MVWDCGMRNMIHERNVRRAGIGSEQGWGARRREVKNAVKEIMIMGLPRPPEQVLR